MDIIALQAAKADAARRYGGWFADAGAGGTADDTTAVQAVLDSGAKTVLFRHGSVYTVSADLLAHTGQTILAYGATIRRKAGTNTQLNLLSIAGTSTSLISDVTVLGGTWEGNRSGVTVSATEVYATNNGIRVAWGRNITIKDAIVQNCWGGGILVGDSVCIGIRIDTCTARYNYDNGLWFRPGVVDGIISNSRAHGHTYHGIDAIRSDYITFSKCHAWDNGPTPTGEGAGFRMEGCRWSSMADCIAWDNGAIGNFALTYTNEGKTGWTWAGAYDDTVQYSAGQAVQWPPQTNPNHSGELTAWYCLTTPPAAGNAPKRNSAYWVPCAYDSGVNTARNNYAISITGCRSHRSYGLGTSGVWVSGGTYAAYESIWYLNTANLVGGQSVWELYVCKTGGVTGSTTAPYLDTTHWLGPIHPSGFALQDVNHVEMTACQADGGYNGLFLGGQNGGSQDVRVRGCDFRNSAWDGLGFGTMVSGAYVEIAECHFDGNRNNAIETPSGQTFTVDVHDNSFTGSVQQARAFYEGGTTTTSKFRRNHVRSQAQTTDIVHFASSTSYVDGTNDMDTRVDHASGTGSFSAATTATVTFTTAFMVAPAAAGIQVTPTGAPAGTFYVSAVSATAFTVTCSASGTWAFSWTARNVAP